MKEKIYTIPVTEAFSEECECPVCVLQKKLEDEYISYFLGPSLMEPDCRLVTNERGFCHRHFELLYNKQENRLGLGLVIDTHIQDQTGKLSGLSKPGRSISPKLIDDTLALLSKLESSCAICSKLEYTMDRYMDVIMYLWTREADFRQIFNSKKGFCLIHFRLLLESAKKYLKKDEAAVFADNLLRMQLANLERIQKEVNWFTKKFDYRYNDAPWENSKDAIQRSIQKLVGYCNLK